MLIARVGSLDTNGRRTIRSLRIFARYRTGGTESVVLIRQIRDRPTGRRFEQGARPLIAFEAYETVALKFPDKSASDLRCRRVTGVQRLQRRVRPDSNYRTRRRSRNDRGRRRKPNEASDYWGRRSPNFKRSRALRRGRKS